MAEVKNQNQIVRKDARNCFVESLNDSFEIGKIHFTFASYDPNRPAGDRQTSNISIYIAAEEFLDLCCKLKNGELKQTMKALKKKAMGERSPLFECLGGTSAEKLAERGRPRDDGKSLSRVAKIIVADKIDLLFIADSGPGDVTDKGLIVPKFGNNPENHVAVSMTFEALSELLLITEAHYNAWLTAWYVKNGGVNK